MVGSGGLPEHSKGAVNGNKKKSWWWYGKRGEMDKGKAEQVLGLGRGPSERVVEVA